VAAGVPVPGRRRFICGGCYFVYDPALGVPVQGVAAHTVFETLPGDWPCPDCGGRKAAFRPFRAQ
jgi:GntR family transcriptional regulator/MocR family aminotransferase